MTIATTRPKRSAVRVDYVTLGGRRTELPPPDEQGEEEGTKTKKRKKTTPPKNNDDGEKTATKAKKQTRRRRKKTLVCGGRLLHLENALNEKELEQLELFLSGDDVQGSLGEAVLHDSAEAQYHSRKCSSAWVPLAELPAQRKLKAAVRDAQDAFESLPRTLSGALRCHYEDVQYCEYGPGGHFKEWHVDADDNGHDVEDGRELTVVRFLLSCL